MKSFWIFFLKKRAFTFMIMGTLVLVGAYSVISIPKESSPEIIIPIGVVSTVLRGGSAEDVEKLVTNKLEQEIANISNIDKVTSVSREGVSIITAQFIASADIKTSIQDLKDAVDKAKGELPTDADEPSVMKINFSDQPVVIVSVSQDSSPKDMTALGEELEKELKKVKGVSTVDVAGTRKKEVQVVIAKDKLANYGLSLNEVIAAIQGANASLPIGSITISDVDYPIKFAGSLDDANQVPNISLRSQNGTIIYLRDIAFISDGLEAPSTYSRISVNGEPSQNALTLSVHKKSGGDVTKITEAINAKIEELKSTILYGSEVVVSVDSGEDVKKDLSELTKTGIETIILVMIVLFLTIGWRESLVAGLSIPLSFVIAFIGLYLSGNTINFISLFSLILAIGILVDSGIVVAEAIHTRLKEHGDVEKAAIASINEYAWPLIAGTMTTVAVFAPLFFLSGTVGQFIKSIPFTIIFVLIASIFVALGMVPILATLITKNKHEENWFTLLQERWFIKAQDWYKSFLGNILKSRKTQNRFLAGLGIAFVLSLTLPVFGLVKVSLFPQDNQNFLYITVEKPQGTPLVNTDISVRQVEEVLYNQKLVTSFVTTVGASSGLSGSGSSQNTKLANITVILDKNRKETSTEVVDILQKELSGISDADIKVDQGNNGPTSGSPVAIKFKGDNLDELTLAAEKTENILNKIKGTKNVQTSLRDDGTQLEINIDKAKASQVGLTAGSVAQFLRGSVSGITATTIKKQGEDLDVMVKLGLNENFINPEDTIKTTLDSIKNLPITTPTGTILLGSIISTNIAQSRAVISHEDEKRIVSVSSDLESDKTALEVVNEFKKMEKDLELPNTVQIDYGGESEEVNNTFRDMILALVAGMALMLAILVLEFNSFRYSLYLLLAIPLSLIGVLGGLALTDRPLSFSAMLGFIALAGVIINHAIILLDSMIHRLEKEKESGSNTKLFDIVVESSAIRLRPIVLTTVTTVVGMIPLAGVSALWGPLAFSIMFGLSFAMILTLILIPMFFYRYPGDKYKSLK